MRVRGDIAGPKAPSGEISNLSTDCLNFEPSLYYQRRLLLRTQPGPFVVYQINIISMTAYIYVRIR